MPDARLSRALSGGEHMRLATPCLSPGCPATAKRRGRCEAHLRQHEAAERAKQPPRGRPWRRLRARVLARDRTCRNCGRPSEHADHVQPRSKGGPDTLSNTQGLCAECNLSKGARVT